MRVQLHMGFPSGVSPVQPDRISDGDAPCSSPCSAPDVLYIIPFPTLSNGLVRPLRPPTQGLWLGPKARPPSDGVLYRECTVYVLHILIPHFWTLDLARMFLFK